MPLSDGEAAIDSLLEQIPQLFGESKVTDIILGPAIQAGMEALTVIQKFCNL